MKKLKILYTIPNFDTAGSGKVVYDLVKGLDKERFAPEILVKHTRGAFFKEVEQLGVPIHVFDYETEYKPFWSFPFRLLKMIRFFKTHDWDIVHSWHWSSDFSEALAVRLAGKKYVYTKKNMSWGNKAWNLKSKFSNHIVTINTAMKTLFFKDFKNVSYIPVGIDTNYFKPRLKSGFIEGIDLKDKFIIISVANMVPVKGIEVLIEAFKKLDLQVEKELELILIGSYNGIYGEKLLQLTAKNKNIHFLGKKMDVRPYLAEADVFVIPTLNKGRKEAQGVAPLEAMAMGIPVIASDLEGLRDVMKGYEQNLFQPGSAEDLKSKLLKILNCNDIRGNKVSDYPDLFTDVSMIRSYEYLYKHVSKVVENQH
jgi:glycosyltransferase involved in cell wall biosynthesis